MPLPAVKKLPPDHPYVKNFTATVHRVGDYWRVKLRSFDGQKQDVDFRSEPGALAFASYLKSNCADLHEEDVYEFEMHNKFWHEAYAESRQS